MLLASTRGNPDAAHVFVRAVIPVPQRGGEPPSPFSVEREQRSMHTMISNETPLNGKKCITKELPCKLVWKRHAAVDPRDEHKLKDFEFVTKED